MLGLSNNIVMTIRALDASAEIRLVCGEPPYSRMVLPYYIAGEIPEQAVFTGDETGFAERDVLLRSGRRVSRISMNDPNSQAMMITCTRRSGEMSVKPRRMEFRAPLSLSVFKSRIAPNTM